MALTAQQFQAWLENPDAIKCILVEVVAEISGIETMLYLSNKNFNTGPTDTPANQSYLPVLNTGVSFSQNLPLDGSASISWGDISIDNTNGTRDSWLGYIWANRAISIYIGDVGFTRSNFTKIYSGYVQDISSRDRNTLSLSIRDMLQRLNTPIYSTVIGGSGTNSDQLRPLVFGEVFNITPVVYNASTLTYMVHDGKIESIIEVRDNGVPLLPGTGYTVDLLTGTFTLLKQPAGVITCSVQGERSTINPSTGGVISHNYTTKYLTWTRSGTTATITHNSHGFISGTNISITESSAETTIPLGVYTITVVNANTYTITCLEPENLIYQSEDLSASPWGSSASATISADTYGTSPFWTIAKTSSVTSEARGQGLGTLSATTYTVSCVLLAGITTSVSVGLYDNTNLSWGTAGNSTAIIISGPGTLTQYAGGLWNVLGLSSTIPTVLAVTRTYTSSATGSLYIYPGTPTSNIVGDSVKVTAVQLNKGSIANTYFKNTNALGTPSGTNTISTYTSSIASIIQVICQKYGTSPLTTSEIDLSSFNSFNTKAPAGIYLTSNTNTIQVCQELADSIGAQFTCSRSGAVKLVRLEEPQSSTTTITDEYILDRSLRLEEKLPVKGAIKLAYCKNWTVQNQLLTGIPEAHKMLLGMEYLYKVVQDTPTLITYNLSGEPTTKNTLLVSNTPESYVTTEATRILNLWKVPRFIYRMDLPSKYLNLDIGQMVVITHGRFGLTGVSAQIVSVQTSWDTGKITIGIMV